MSSLQEEDRAAPAVTRGSMLKISGGATDQYRLEIGICGATKSDGEEVLEVSTSCILEARHHLHARERSKPFVSP